MRGRRRFPIHEALLGLVVACDAGAGASPAPDPPARVEAGDEAAPVTAADPRPPSPYRCEVPPLPIPRPRACRRGREYPRCKWQMPLAPRSGGRYRRWRNTIPEHWWAREGTVRFVLAVADDFRRAYPEQALAIGDLDAPGPRHETHDRGVDVDLYLPGALMAENAGGGRYPSNYEGKTPAEVEALRARVLGLAEILATCSAGAVRIYYNDAVVKERFLAWYARQGFDANPFPEGPMVAHNRLHRFHFHVSVPETLPGLPFGPGADAVTHPEAPIRPPPPPESAPNLSSRTRRD
ncbi:MAG: hypothetical protein AAGH15_22625 [Myxococcota bacterium]